MISRKQIEDVLRPHFGTTKALRMAVRDVQNLTQLVGASRPSDSLLAQAIEQCDGCMDETQVEPEDAAAWKIVRSVLTAGLQPSGSKP